MNINLVVFKKITSVLFSTRLTAVLFLLFATAMGIATFIENDFNTETSKALVFNTWWFETILVFFVINFIGNIKRYRLLKKDKLSILLLHLSFIVIILGSGVTRYFSFEGLMPIVEGETSSMLLSEKKYLSVTIDDNEVQKTWHKPLLLSKSQSQNHRTFLISFLEVLSGKNNFEIEKNFKNIPFNISYLDYVPNAQAVFKSATSGSSHLHIVASTRDVREDHYLKAGDRLSFIEADITFQNQQLGAINIYQKGNHLYVKSHRQLQFLKMASQETGILELGVEHRLKTRTLYTLGRLQFVVPEPPLKGEIKYSSHEDTDRFPLDMLKLKLSVKDKTANVEVFGGQFVENEPKRITLGNVNFSLQYGSKKMKLPFSLKLNDFILEKYPGSSSPKAFTSKLTLISDKESFDTKVYMNNVLDYKGYRLFQSSYDEQGALQKTILSVNHDKTGTLLTYFGYALLFLGLIAMLLSPKTHFGKQRKRLKKLRNKALLGLLIMCFGIGNALEDKVSNYQDVIVSAKTLPSAYVQQFSKLILQDPGGRMKPVNTFGSELLRKLTKKDEFMGLSSDQVVLSIFLSPNAWKDVPIIFITKNNTKLRDQLKLPHSQKFAKLSDFFNSDGSYIIEEEVIKASKKKIKNKYEQSLLNVDGRVILTYLAIQGDLFKFIPMPQDDENTWLSLKEAKNRQLTDARLTPMITALQRYKLAMQSANDNSLLSPNKLLSEISKSQITYSKAILPSNRKVALELFYNKYDIFKNLFWQYMLASLLLFVVVIISVFKGKNKIVTRAIKGAVIVVFLLFLYHTLGLAIRWYISGHAPWSNGYESMIYIAWATLFFGLLIGRKSGLTIAATTFVTSMILMVAHWNWMDPTIGNLVPVLDSYWLMVHVAIIVASYGPFAIGMILGMIALVLFLLKTKNNFKKIENVITELTLINELALTIGLVMLTIGNFLGAIWANESWGRYWGWDPKETWALISIMVYAFVLHMRLVPKLRGQLHFNIASVFAFASILMTYLGVNHLLSGLHSYAAGEAAPIPNEIIGWLLLALALSVMVLIKRYKNNKNLKIKTPH